MPVGPTTAIRGDRGGTDDIVMHCFIARSMELEPLFVLDKIVILASQR